MNVRSDLSFPLTSLLTSDEKGKLLRLSRATLQGAFSETPGSCLEAFERDLPATSSALKDNLPCFVTLLNKNGRLRGCIGSMVSFNPLYKNVYHMTRQAAFEDPRFNAVKALEVPDLTIHIAVLGPLRPVVDLNELILGEQGLQVSYGEKRGVLLASVAIDHGFTKEQFLAETCLKAGLDPNRVKNYQVSTFDELSFEEN